VWLPALVSMGLRIEKSIEYSTIRNISEYCHSKGYGDCGQEALLFMTLCRLNGIPARWQSGWNTFPGDKSNHDWSEIYLAPYGWVPVDPADVRKVALEEPPGNLALNDAMVAKAQKQLFGAWEMNWMAYNYAHDVALPGSAGKPVVYFMYPQAETAEGRVDPFDPDNFKYEITAKQVG